MKILNKLKAYIEQRKQDQQAKKVQLEKKLLVARLYMSSINHTMMKKY